LESVVVREERRLVISYLHQKPSTRMPMLLSPMYTPHVPRHQQQPSWIHRRPPWFRRCSSANQAKSLISIIIFSLAYFPHTGTNTEDYIVYASRRLPASRATPCQLFLRDIDRQPQAWCTKLGGSYHDVSCTECWRRTTATP
jgi:hypothetical protein